MAVMSLHSDISQNCVAGRLSRASLRAAQPAHPTGRRGANWRMDFHSDRARDGYVPRRRPVPHFCEVDDRESCRQELGLTASSAVDLVPLKRSLG